MIRTIQMSCLVAWALFFTASQLHAAGTPEETCLKGRYDAAAKYSACQQKAFAKYFAHFQNDPSFSHYDKLRAAASKCRVKYAAVWPKLQAKAPGSTCDTTRFTDNGTTVTDNLTGLEWEKKTDDDSIHDKDNLYTWNVDVFFDAAYTTFLRALNGGGGCDAGFAFQCDWRLPTIYELHTILSEAAPCTASPCIDPIFGPTVASDYWSATTGAGIPTGAWGVLFNDGLLDFNGKDHLGYARAVRGGL